MSNYRTSKLFALKSYSADASELIPITISDPISRLLIQFEGQNMGSTPTVAHPAACIKKIELVDGSDVLFSLDGLEAYALQFYHTKTLPSDYLIYLNDNWFHVTFKLDFGRWLWDPELALDPKRFNNLQLKIETDQDAGGCQPDNSKLQVMASIFDGKSVAPAGMLTARRIKQYTMGSASHEYTDLPTDRKIRKLMIKALKIGTELCQTMDKIKLSEDFDKKVILDNSPDEIDRLYPEENALYEEGFYGFARDMADDYFHVTPSDRGQVVANQWATTISAYNSTYGIVGMRTRIRGSANNNFNAIARGFNPCSTVSIPLGDEWDPADWLDPAGLKQLRLDLLSLSGGSGSNAEIVVQQYRPY